VKSPASAERILAGYWNFLFSDFCQTGENDRLRFSRIEITMSGECVALLFRLIARVGLLATSQVPQLAESEFRQLNPADFPGSGSVNRLFQSLAFRYGCNCEKALTDRRRTLMVVFDSAYFD
jgi:hypothetical protein